MVVGEFRYDFGDGFELVAESGFCAVEAGYFVGGPLVPLADVLAVGEVLEAFVAGVPTGDEFAGLEAHEVGFFECE